MMKYVLLYFIVSIVTCITLCAGNNIVKNGSFEFSSASGKLKDWEQWPAKLSPGDSVKQGDAFAYKGGKSLRIRHKNATSYSRVQQVNVKVKPNTKYIMSCYFKGSELKTIPGGAGARIFVGRRGGLSSTFFSINAPTDMPSYNWRKVSYGPFDTGKETLLGIAPYLHRTSGTIWIDNIELLEVTPDMEKQQRISLNRDILENDLDTLKKIAEKSNKTKYLKKLKKLKKEIQNKELTDEIYDPRSGIPFCPEQGKILKIMASLLREIYPNNTLLVTKANPFSQHNYLSLPSKLTKRVISTDIRDDVGQFVLNFTNIAKESIKLNISLPEELTKLNIKIRKVVYIDKGDGSCLDDALPRLYPNEKSGQYTISLYPGLSQQIWFEYHTPDMTGTYEGQIKISYDGKVKKIPVKVKTVNIKLPKTLPIATHPYAYLPTRSFTKNRISQAVSDLKKHHMNMFLPHSWMEGLPDPVFDNNGKFLPEKMDWAKFDKARKIRGSVDKYAFTVERIFTDMNKFKHDSPEWEKLIKDWIQAVVKGLKSRGIGYDKIIITARDEPNGKYIKIASDRYKLIREIDPKLVLYSNFFEVSTPEEIKPLLAYVDIIAPEVACLTKEYLPMIKASGTRLWTYNVQAKQEKPDFIRNLFWKMSENNIKGFTFWTYAEDVSSPWTPHDHPRNDYAVIYDGDKNEITPSKRWEACREGIEDYILLDMLKKQSLEKYIEIIGKYKQNDNVELIKKEILKYLSLNIKNK